jgi:hypothetical protein
MILYSLSHILDLEQTKNYKIEESTLKCLSDIDILVGSPNYVKTPRFNKKQEYENSKWESFRTFKKTVIVNKNSSDIEKYKMEIRDLLNKLTTKTYEPIREKILKLLEELNTDELKIICPIMFDIMSSNIFYSDEYSTLFKELINKYEIILSTFKSNFSNFLNIFKSIEYVSADENYNEFCRINKINEKRRSQSKFFSNLMIKEIIPQINILKIVLTLQERIVLYISDEKNKNIIEEIIENISIILNTIYTEFDNKNEHMKLIIGNIKWLLENEKEYNAITNKAIFKYMDMLDNLKIDY